MSDNTRFKEEIADYSQKIRVVLGNDEIDSKQIINLFDSIRSVSSITGLTLVYTLTESIINILKNIEINKSGINERIIDTINIVLVYIKEIITAEHTKPDTVSIKKLLVVLNKTASGLDTDIDEAFIIDIVKKKLVQPQDVLESGIDPSRTITMNLKNVDTIMTKVNELIVTQYQLKQKIEKIYSYGRTVDAILTSPDIDVNDIKNENKKLKLLESDVKNSILKFDRSSYQLQDSILSLRMVPIILLTDDIKNTAELLSAKFNKKISVSIVHNRIILDTLILENIKQPVLNSIANCIEHGIESPEERLSKGKNPEGTIKVVATTDNGNINISIEDDGCGVDYKKIVMRAISLFPHKKQVLLQSGIKKLNRLLFIPGITSAEVYTGRGFGLTTTEKHIDRIKGRILLENRANNGVKVTFTVPKSLTTLYGYFVTAGKSPFFIPSIFVSEIIIIDKNEVMDLVTKQAVKLRDDIIPIYPLTGILKGKTPSDSDTLFILITEMYNEKTGIIVDEILYHTSTVYKPLPKNIQSIKGIQGVVFDEEFRIVTIIYIPKIVSMLKEIKNIDYKTRYSTDAIQYKSVLIVDDSPVNREIESIMLKRSKINTDTATDGIDALEKLKESTFHLIITDTAMPRMDGLTFIENCRKIPGYEKTPVIVLSSSKKTQRLDDYIAAGANSIHYKSNFDRDIFLGDIKKLLGISNG
ncbi:MAG: hypothetical protein A2015_06275 [Spirochaetes bacterium GWF1_31_7]|nr:MAG: hypothetical protein A2Y30_08110 [Spirochaetes bacterium GWE1_32_154]OHD51353.1 MAG: hypothetical protein A2Y29_14495 [Spirochaetes bacterium GWE2_31_10]OHD53079.1 MAG: hypothetical protein A2015_06275 [Spirochaetes bacterium GWF1_31_7]HBD95142.1 hypothetical protein [Spirochaetia bacterium]HBI36148.1 hypothetical protein [Spirochaetia bacterium]